MLLGRSIIFPFHKIYLSPSKNKRSLKNACNCNENRFYFERNPYTVQQFSKEHLITKSKKKDCGEEKNNFLAKDPQSSTKSFFHKNDPRLKRIIFKPAPFCWMRASAWAKVFCLTSSPFNFFQMMYQCWWNNSRVLFSRWHLFWNSFYDSSCPTLSRQSVLGTTEYQKAISPYCFDSDKRDPALF